MAGSLVSATYAITNNTTPRENIIDIDSLPANIDLASETTFYAASTSRKVIILNGVRITATDDDGIAKSMKIYLARDLFKLIHIDLATPNVSYSLSSDLDISAVFTGGITVKIWNPYFYNGTSGWQPFGITPENIADMFQNIKFGLILKFTRPNGDPGQSTIQLDSEGAWEISTLTTPPVAVQAGANLSTVSFTHASSLKTATKRMSLTGKILTMFGLSMADIRSDTDVYLATIAYVGSATGADFASRHSMLTDQNGAGYQVRLHRPSAEENVLTISIYNAETVVNPEIYEEASVGWVGNYEDFISRDSEITVDIGEPS